MSFSIRPGPTIQQAIDFFQTRAPDFQTRVTPGSCRVLAIRFRKNPLFSINPASRGFSRKSLRTIHESSSPSGAPSPSERKQTEIADRTLGERNGCESCCRIPCREPRTLPRVVVLPDPAPAITRGPVPGFDHAGWSDNSVIQNHSLVHQTSPPAKILDEHFVHSLTFFGFGENSPFMYARACCITCV